MFFLGADPSRPGRRGRRARRLAAREPWRYLGHMHPTGVATAAWVFASEPSKTPFYLAGGLLAAWAVLLGPFGVSHPDFPARPGPRGLSC